MKTFEENMKDIKTIQDSWLNYYDENGNLCDKDGNIIEKAPENKPIESPVKETVEPVRYF